MPSKAWKKSVTKLPWFPGETVVAGIGQGQVSATPLQLAAAGATLAAGGVRRRPHLLLATQAQVSEPIIAASLEPPNQVSFIKNPANVTAVRDAMIAVLHSATGTARAVGNGAPFLMAGKTGTAQQISANAPRNANGQVDPRFKNQALFVGFAPAMAPKIAVGLIVEQGGSGAHAAAPVARAIFEAFLPKSSVQASTSLNAIARPNPLEPLPTIEEEQVIDELEVELPSDQSARPEHPAPAQ